MTAASPAGSRRSRDPGATTQLTSTGSAAARFSRSAANWIGVSGFLISCAMRRATSAQAALRCADCNSVMSSKVATKPSVRPPVRSAPMRTSSVRRRLPAPIWISAVRARSGEPCASRISGANSGTISASTPPGGGHQVDAQQFVRRPVGQLDPALRVQPDHPGRDAGQHRLGEPPALVDLAVGVHQFGALGGELPGHAVEGARQAGHFVVGADFRHAHGQVAGAHPLGGVDQPADGPRDLVRHHQPDQHRRRQHQQRHQRENPREGHLQPGAAFVQPAVFGDRLLGARHVGQDLRIDGPADQQHQRRRRIELHDGAHAGAVVGVQHHGVAQPAPFRWPSAAGCPPRSRTTRPRP